MKLFQNILLVSFVLVATAASADSTSAPPALGVASAAPLQVKSGVVQPASGTSFSYIIADASYKHCALNALKWVVKSEYGSISFNGTNWILSGSIGGSDTDFGYICFK